MKSYTFKNGDSFPALGLGTWQSEKGAVGKAVKNAIEAGYRHIDCAAIYENEAEIGEALAEVFAAGQVKREDLFITSKLWNNKHLKDDVRKGIDGTLKDLQLDYLDLYLMHWPIAFKPGVGFPEKSDEFLSPEEAPYEVTWEEMTKLHQAGLCRHIGVSNFNANKLTKLCREAEHAPEVNQVECHPLLAQHELLKTCNDLGVVMTAYSPIGSPGGAGSDSDLSVIESPDLKAIGEGKDASAAQIALAWAVQRGTVAIPKSTHEGRIKENLAAADIELSDEEMKQINAIDKGHRFIEGDGFTIEGSPYTLEWLWEK